MLEKYLNEAFITFKTTFLPKKSSCFGMRKDTFGSRTVYFINFVLFNLYFDITMLNLRIKETKSFKMGLPSSYSNMMISTKKMFHNWINRVMKFRKTENRLKSMFCSR